VKIGGFENNKSFSESSKLFAIFIDKIFATSFLKKALKFFNMILKIFMKSVDPLNLAS